MTIADGRNTQLSAGVEQTPTLEVWDSRRERWNMASSPVAVDAVPLPSYAGLGRRLAAYLLDTVIAISVVFIAGFVMRGFRVAGLWMPGGGGTFDPIATWRALAWSSKLAILLAFALSTGPIYLALFESSRWQASFGKRLLGIYVTDDVGGRIGAMRAFGRWFAKWFFNWFWSWLLSMVSIAVGKRKKALHDFVAGTLVVRGRPVPGGSLEPWR